MLLLLLAAVASAAARGGAIPVLACAETQVLALSSPAIELCFCFRIGFAVIYSKKVCQPAAAVQKHVELCISHLFFGVFLCASHFASVFTVFLPTLDFPHMPASTCICLSALCGGGGWGGGGVMTSMRMRLVSSVSLVASYVCRISHRFLRCFCRLSTFCTCQLRLAFVFQLCAGVGGMGGMGDDVHPKALVAASCLKRQPCKNLELF